MLQIVGVAEPRDVHRHMLQCDHGLSEQQTFTGTQYAAQDKELEHNPAPCHMPLVLNTIFFVKKCKLFDISTCFTFEVE